MTKITFIAQDGSATSIDAEDGTSVMQAAVFHGMRGIVGECGGSLMCSTCHVYVSADAMERLGPPSGDEEDMLDAVAADRLPTSRLSCQIKVGPELEGLVMTLPKTQY